MIPSHHTPDALADCPLAHLAIAVESIAAAAPLYVSLGFTAHEIETVEREKVRVQLLEQGALRIELLEPLNAGEGPIGRYLGKRGAGLHHVALWCSALEERLAHLEKIGVRTLPGYPAAGASGTRVAFLDPKTTGGVLFELVHKSVV